MVFASILAPLRSQARRAVRVSPAPFRALHASSSVLKKKPVAAVDEDPFAEEDEEEDDLFSVTSEPSPVVNVSQGNAKEAYAAARTSVIETIESVSALNPREIRSQAPAVKAGSLRKVIEWSAEPAGLEGLPAWFKAWRLMGKNVTEKTASSLVGACLRYHRPELALQLFSNPVQYGRMVLHPRQLSRLYCAYLFRPASTPLAPPLASYKYSPTSALWSLLALRHSLSAESSSETAEAASSSESKVDTGRVIQAHLSKLLQGGLVDHLPAEKSVNALEKRVERLEQAGEEWKAAVQKIRNSPVTIRTKKQKQTAAEAEGTESQ